MDLIIEIRPKPGKSQELCQVLQALLPTIRKEKNCRDCRISRDGKDDEVFFLDTCWEAQASLENYLQSASGMTLLGAIDVLSERAAVKTDPDAPWQGIDVLKRMRRKYA
jgi:quinol monooxygenase YgiN